jgi:hypothetical protein
MNRAKRELSRFGNLDPEKRCSNGMKTRQERSRRGDLVLKNPATADRVEPCINPQAEMEGNVRRGKERGI